MKRAISVCLVFLLLIPSSLFSFLDGLAGSLIDTAADKGIEQAENAVFGSDKEMPDLGRVIEEKEAAQYAERLLDKMLEAEGSGKINGSIFLNDTKYVQGWVSFLTGEIHITKGMLSVIENEAMLAGLISHEIGHLALNHAERRSQNSPLSAVISAGLDAAVKDARLKSILDKNQYEIIEAGWGQELESEADRYGAELAASSGYDPYQFVKLFRKLADFVDKDMSYRVRKLKGTHKALDERADSLERYLQEKGYASGAGMTERDKYVKAMAGLFTGTSVENKAAERAAEISAKAEKYRLEKKRMPQEEFLSLVSELVKIADENGITKEELRQALAPADDAGGFMEELIEADTNQWGNNTVFSGVVDALKSLARIGVGAIPVVGDTLDLYEILTGKDAFTGNKLTGFERTMSCMGVLAGSGSMWREAANGLNEQLVKYASSNADEARTALKTALENFETSGDIKRGYAGSLNKRLLDESKKMEPPYMKGTSYYEFELNKNREFYRAYSQNMESDWVMDFDPRIMSSEKIKEYAAMPKKPNSVALVKVPAGTKLRMSVAGKNKLGEGGIVQYELLGSEVKSYTDRGIEFIRIGDIK